ncbi:sugar kinase [Thioclava sp. 15-R06ZXC-3]|uniref:Sugar kinase n=1 Tax=Thioclava arctica TaxID=3238301 RepID=A0ABV3TNF3_9RHOB
MDILCIGEPLAEFTNDAANLNQFHRRLGGDMLNAAIYLARLRPDLRIGYLSRLGDDAMSRWMRNAIAAEGVDVSGVALEPHGSPGLSFISTDEDGERSFVYWRDQSPARRMFSPEMSEAPALSNARAVLFSGIALAILPAAARARMLSALAHARAAGCLVAYDTNYRARLWTSHQEATDWSSRALAVASVALPSLEDMGALWGCDTPEAALQHCARFATGEIVLTTGGGAVLHRSSAGEAQSIALPAPVRARDTTAAGDSFDAGFLSAFQRRKSPREAVLAGARLAARVVQFPGAIIPKSAMHEEIAEHAV